MGKARFFMKTSILITSNVISGILVFVFTLVLSREIGARGMGLYQLIMPLYSMLVCIAGGGITVAMSRIAAREKSSGKLPELFRTVRLVFLIELLWSVFIAVMTAVGASLISEKLLLDNRTCYGIIAICPAVVMVSLNAVIKGAYYGLQRVCEPAIIDTVEKAVKILLMYLMVRVIKGVALEYAVAAALFAVSIGESIAFFILFAAYKKFVRSSKMGMASHDAPQLCFEVFKVMIPISMEGWVTAIFGTLTVILIPKRLQSTGLSYEEALSLVGKLQGMAMNVVFFPMIINTAYHLLLIPSLAETNNTSRLSQRINSAIKLALMTSTAASAIIMSAPLKLGDFFYGDMVVGRLIFMFGPILPLIYIELLSYAILNGLGKQNRLLLYSILIQTVGLMLLWFLVGNPRLNIYGYACNLGLSAIFGIFLNFRLIIQVADLKVRWIGTVGIPLLCGILTYLTAYNYIFQVLEVPAAILASAMGYLLIYSTINVIGKQIR